MINQEGVDSLSVEELQNACVARGMRSMGVPIDRLRSNFIHVFSFFFFMLDYVFSGFLKTLFAQKIINKACNF